MAALAFLAGHNALESHTVWSFVLIIFSIQNLVLSSLSTTKNPDPPIELSWTDNATPITIRWSTNLTVWHLKLFHKQLFVDSPMALYMHYFNCLSCSNFHCADMLYIIIQQSVGPCKVLWWKNPTWKYDYSKCESFRKVIVICKAIRVFQTIKGL